MNISPRALLCHTCVRRSTRSSCLRSGSLFSALLSVRLENQNQNRSYMLLLILLSSRFLYTRTRRFTRSRHTRGSRDSSNVIPVMHCSKIINRKLAQSYFPQFINTPERWPFHFVAHVGALEVSSIDVASLYRKKSKSEANWIFCFTFTFFLAHACSRFHSHYKCGIEGFIQCAQHSSVYKNKNRKLGHLFCPFFINPLNGRRFTRSLWTSGVCFYEKKNPQIQCLHLFLSCFRTCTLPVSLVPYVLENHMFSNSFAVCRLTTN